MELGRLQAIFARLITAPEGTGAALHQSPADAAFLDLIAGDKRLDRVVRLEIYADAYFYRLLDALKEDYPTILSMIGAIDFHNLITGYLLAHPPSKPSIFHAGEHLAEYLRGHPLSDAQPWLPELAMLERGLLESFHSLDAAPLAPAALAALAPEQWPALTFTLHPSMRIFDLGWRVEQAVAAASAGSPPVRPAAEPGVVLVWRSRDGGAAYRALDPAEGAALRQIAEGAAFAEICSTLAGHIIDENRPAEINRRFARWVADGLLCAA